MSPKAMWVLRLCASFIVIVVDHGAFVWQNLLIAAAPCVGFVLTVSIRLNDKSGMLCSKNFFFFTPVNV